MEGDTMSGTDLQALDGRRLAGTIGQAYSEDEKIEVHIPGQTSCMKQLHVDTAQSLQATVCYMKSIPSLSGDTIQTRYTPKVIYQNVIKKIYFDLPGLTIFG